MIVAAVVVIIRKRSEGANVAAPATVLIVDPLYPPVGTTEYQVLCDALAMSVRLSPVPFKAVGRMLSSVSPDAAASVVGNAARLRIVIGNPSEMPGVVPGVPGAVGPTLFIFGSVSVPPAAND